MYMYNCQFQSVSGSDAADLKNNFSDSTEIGGRLIPTKSLLRRISLISSFDQCMCLKQLILKIISHKVGTLRRCHYRNNELMF